MKKLLELTSLARSQDTGSTHRNQLHCYKLATNTWKPKSKTQCHLQLLKKNVSRYKSNKTCTGFVCWKLQNADERNQRQPKCKERYTVFMDGKTQQNKVVNFPQIDLCV